ncbi:Peptidyl-prolyl cis-trans isomerase cyp18 [Xylophilus ampelinus]|nr:Peptidyl-prolyl cis-trans isomerase cyp18 [Xylophilus ampelinus]
MTLPSFSRRAACTALLAVGLSHLPAMAQGTPRVKLATSLGDIVLELDATKAPKTVENFLQYVKDKHYDGTVFHRVIDGFMIQGGGYSAQLKEKSTRAPIPLEASNGLKNDRGTIAMARTSDPNSATSQFFINVKNNDMLNAPNPDGHGYTVFGKVVSGMDVVDKIRAVATGVQGGMRDVPTVPVEIRSATVVK